MKRVFTQIFPLWFPRQLPWTTLFLYLTSPLVQLFSFISSFYLLLLLNSYAGCAKLTNDLSVSVHYLLPHWNQGTSSKLGFCMFGGEKNVLGWNRMYLRVTPCNWGLYFLFSFLEPNKNLFLFPMIFIDWSLFCPTLLAIHLHAAWKHG